MNNKKRAKSMLPAIKELISQRALESDQKREELADSIIEEIKESYPNEVPPKWETVIKKISYTRKHEPSPLDILWHLGLLTKAKNHSEYYMPSEAIPFVLAAQESQKMLTRHRDITIRQALWISRLYKMVKQKDDLQRIAWHYAFYERISEISGTVFNTTEYDRLLVKPKELIEYFEAKRGISYDIYKTAFEQTTNGIEYMGPSMPVDHLLICDNKVYATFMIQGTPKRLEMPCSDPNELLRLAEKQKTIKSVKKLKSGEIVVRFKETISLAFENREYNEFLHNLVQGVKNERTHNTTK